MILSILSVSLSLLAYFGLAFARVRSVLSAFAGRPARPAQSALLASLLALPYLLVSLPVGGAALFPGLLIMLAYLLLPTLLLALRPTRHRPLDLFDLLAILSLWMPVEFDLLPEATARLGGVNLPVSLITVVGLGFFLFLIVRPLEEVGYTYRLNLRDLLYAICGWLAFFVPGILLGMSLGFIRVGTVSFNPEAWLARFLVIYFFNALPEEMLFRGGIQNLIQLRWGKNWRTLLGAALVFGLAHVNNTTGHHVPPNWAYVAMATLAGLAYGWVWRERCKITAAALTHTLVNFVWSVVFTG